MRRGLVSEVFATESAADRFGPLLAGAPVHLVTEKAAKALSDTVTPVGLVAVCTLPEVDLAEVLTGEPTLVAVPVGFSEPGNAGSVIRVAAAMGVAPEIEYLPARHEVLHAHSSHDKIARVLGHRPATPLDDGLRAMAAWVRTHGARATPPFGAIEIEKNLPASWRA